VASGDGRLASGLGAVLHGTVTGLRRLSGGASRQTWSFDLVDSDGDAQPLVVQIERPGGRMGTGIATEANLLREAERAAVPVPRVVASGDDDGLGAAWLVVERVEGETIPRKLLRDPEFAAARARLPAQCGRALAAIHSIPVDAVPDLQGDDQLAQFHAVLDGFAEPRPALELAYRRLDATRPSATGGQDAAGTPTSGQRAVPAAASSLPTSVVHGDFRTGNLLVDATGLRAVLDWELAHIGDPLEDLGWMCVRAWRFGSPHRAGGFGPLDELLAAYEEASGTRVDTDAVRWWEAVGTFKWGVMCMVQAAAHRSGASRSVELATIGRRVCENEWDLLGLLGASLPDPVTPPDAPTDTAAPMTSPFGYPTAAELVEAVREWLDSDVRETTEGRLRFHTRVAANALGMVQRELVAGGRLARDHAARLASLGFDDDVTLAAAIRAGECDDRWEDIAAALALSVRDQLLVANPRHLMPDGWGPSG
jgi:aminoglycoside phosphotransferase (APT) family kinase protein